MTEFVPTGESVNDWSQMVTVQIFHGATIDPASFLEDVGKRYMSDCPGTTARGIFTGQANGYVVSMLLLRCPDNPRTGKPETTGFRVTKGQDTLYSLQYAWRAVATDQQVDAAMHVLAAALVCDLGAPGHPCGSPGPAPARQP